MVALTYAVGKALMSFWVKWEGQLAANQRAGCEHRGVTYHTVEEKEVESAGQRAGRWEEFRGKAGCSSHRGRATAEFLLLASR